MEQTDIAIIGAGVIGLAVSAALGAAGRDVVLIEQHGSFGRETSSRNSEVIHAGLYYAPGSLKARLCVEGNRRLYAFCARHGIANQRTGKLIVARCSEEEPILEKLRIRGEANGVEGLRYLSSAEAARWDGIARIQRALHVPSTGIVDSHALMKRLAFEAERDGVVISYGTRLLGVSQKSDGYVCHLRDGDGERLDLSARVVVNCAGLEADTVAAMAGLDVDSLGYRLHYLKGEYYRVANRRALPRDILVYPVPLPHTLGNHTVMDLQGEVKLGPRMVRVDRQIDYSIDPSRRTAFHDSVKDLFPQVRLEDLEPDMAGLSPTLDGESPDFIITHEEVHGLPGWIDLIGMNSPGLTSCLAIADHVKGLLT